MKRVQLRQAQSGLEKTQVQARLAAIRAGLRDELAASPLCDLAGYGEAVGTALIGLWRRACGR